MLGAVPGPLHKVSYLILWEVNTSTIPILQMKLCLRGKTPFPKSHCLGNGGRVIETLVSLALEPKLLTVAPRLYSLLARM